MSYGQQKSDGKQIILQKGIDNKEKSYDYFVWRRKELRMIPVLQP